MSPALRFLHWTTTLLASIALLAALLYAAAATASVPLALGLAFALFSSLSVIAYLLLTTPPDAIKLRPWFSILIIVSVAASAHIVGTRNWSLPLSAAPATHLFNLAALPPTISAVINLLLTVVLITVLLLKRKSPWWAALYAWHPLTIVQFSSGQLLSTHAFPGFFATLFGWLSHPARDMQFFALVALLLTAALAFLYQWPITRTITHLMLIGLLLSPSICPWFGLLPLALCTIQWNRAAWLLSFTLLLNYTASNGTVPLWALAFQWTPVLVLEIQQLFTDCRRRSDPVQPSPEPALPLTTIVATHGT